MSIIINKVQKFKKLSKLLIAYIIVASILFCAFFIFNTYYNTIHIAEERTLEKLESITQTLALLIDGDAHERLTCHFLEKNAITTNHQQKDYYHIYNLLHQTQKVNHLPTTIYTLFLDNEACNPNVKSNELYFGVSSNAPFYRHIYREVQDALFVNYEKGGRLSAYDDEHGSWISAFSPIKNSDGKTVAIVQADEHFDTFRQNALSDILRNMLIPLLLLLFLLVIFVIYIRKMLHSMVGINNMLENLVYQRTEQLADSNQQLQMLANDLEIRVIRRTEALEKANQALQTSNKELESFAHVASHDLKEPLRMIRSYLNLFSRRYANQFDENAKAYIGFANTGAIRMEQLIEDLLAYSRLKGTAEQHQQNVNITRVVDIAKQNLKVAIEEKKAQIFSPNEMPSVLGNRSLLIQLFQNLIANAIKFNQKNVAPIVHIKIRDKVHFCEFEVTDNGIGIAEADFEKIFKIFKRLHSRQDYKGTGLGLATCKRIVELHGGQITVKSELGKGTSFFFFIPKQIS